MPVKRTTDATTEPLTVAEAKRHLREDLVDANNDTDIGVLITAARTAAENRLNRTLITSTWTLTLDEFPEIDDDEGVILLPMGRVITVSSVKYLDSAGTLTTLDAALYTTDLTGDIGRIFPAYGTSWPLTREQSNAVTVVYTAGFGATAASVPAPIVTWIKLAIGDLYGQRERSSDRPAVPQDFADSLLDSYKIYGA